MWVKIGICICVEREEFYNGIGLGLDYINSERELGRYWLMDIKRRMSNIERRTIECKINSSKCNPRYKKYMCNALPKYLCDGKPKSHISTLARLRCGNFKRYIKYRLKDDDRLCVFCNKDYGTLEHL